MFFARGYSDRQIYEELSRYRFVPRKDLSMLLKKFDPPLSSQMHVLSSYLKQMQSKPVLERPQEFKHLWFIDDTFIEMICFTFLSKSQKENQSDFILISENIKYEFKLCVIYGIDLTGAQSILFVAVSRENSYKHALSLLEKYEEAGFKAPEHVLCDSEMMIDACSQKYGKSKHFTMCKYAMLRKLKEILLCRISAKQAKTLVRKCNSIIASNESLADRVERSLSSKKVSNTLFQRSFNELYVTLSSD